MLSEVANEYEDNVIWHSIYHEIGLDGYEMVFLLHVNPNKISLDDVTHAQTQNHEVTAEKEIAFVG